MKTLLIILNQTYFPKPENFDEKMQEIINIFLGVGIPTLVVLIAIAIILALILRKMDK
jgi:hypothetical protein